MTFHILSSNPEGFNIEATLTISGEGSTYIGCSRMTTLIFALSAVD
jgi:hypothetical protein